ncbi:epsin-1 isoform X4 [Nilaparvata lugens]|uniref:epsin-1 isoform X4 n=2 Tax=Nilaparvata lugens TaxID=108931 RepID=UPI00193CDE63|nr:epsin-1 isoform X4 [Nilaparvata lugens]
MNLNFAFETAVPRQSNPKTPNKMKRQREDMQVNVAGLRRNIKNLAHNYSDAQVKVREATSNDPWGPNSTLMSEIADLTYNVVAFTEIMQMIWKRLNDHGKNWRHVYKALVLLEYLIKTGSEKVATQCKENIFAIQTLRDFQYLDENKDHGMNVREKANKLASLLRDDDRLKNERTKALKAKERFAQTASAFGSDTGLQFRDSWRTPSCDSDSTPTRAGAAGELECARPQTVGEEELQLQLALAMSREEAEQEEQKRRSDDVRLQLALSQSENEFKQKKDSPSHMLDLLDVSIGAPSPPPSSAVDPWGMPAAPPPPPPPSHPPRPQTLDIMYSNWDLTDPWSLSTGTGASTVSSAADPWAPVSSPAQTIQKTPVMAGAGNDPWRAVSPAAARPAVTSDPWSPASVTDMSPSHSLTSPTPTPTQAHSDLDEFDFISKRTVNNANSLNNNRTDSTSPDPFDLSGLGDTLSTTNSAPKKTPHSFLGENSGLVNLDNLVTKPVSPPNQPIHPVPAAALANPFSMVGGGGGQTTQPLFPPGYTPSNSTGQLQQPLMPQPNPFLS